MKAGVRVSALLILLFPSVLSAVQVPPANGEDDRLASGFAVLSANAVVGGATAGFRALLEGKNIPRAFARGTLGGALGYAGKRVAVLDWGAAPITGRMIATVGNSIILQAGETGSILDSVRVPVGPLRLGFSRERGFRPSISVVASDLALLIQAFTKSDLHFDWNRSLSAATPVFLVRPGRLARDGERIGGLTAWKLVLLDDLVPGNPDRVFPHEVVHVLQHDFIEAAWDRPIEDWIRRHAPGARIVPRWLNFDMVALLLIELDDVLNDNNGVLRRLREAEAEWFEHR